MSTMSTCRRLLGTGVLAVAMAGAVLWAQAITGPSSSASPFVLPAEPGVVTKSILTVGDSIGGYRLVGIPDGLGAFDNEDGTFTLLMNHEIASNLGVPRAHGAKGAFVSKWIIRKDDLAVIHAESRVIADKHGPKSRQTFAGVCGDWPDVVAAKGQEAQGFPVGRGLGRQRAVASQNALHRVTAAQMRSSLMLINAPIARNLAARDSPDSKAHAPSIGAIALKGAPLRRLDPGP
jgi:hypothetical protein